MRPTVLPSPEQPRATGSSDEPLVPCPGSALQDRTDALGGAAHRPQAASGSRPDTSDRLADSDSELTGADTLCAVLCGVVPPCPAAEIFSPATWFDPALTPAQQQAVRQAVAVEDLFLLVGAPGTGKSRVVAEIAAQAASQGQRVLVTAPKAAPLDACLERLQNYPAISAVRLLAPHEETNPSAGPARNWCLERQTACLRQRCREQAAQQLAAWQQRGQTLQEEARLVLELRQLAIRRHELDEQRERLRNGADNNPPAQTENPLRADPRSLAAECERLLAEEEKRHLATLNDLDQRIQQALEACRQKEQEHVAWLARVREQELVVQTRKVWKPFSLRFWACWLQGRAPQRLEEFRQRAEEAEAAVREACGELDALRQQRLAAEQRHQVACQQILADEAARRQAELDAQLARLDEVAEQVNRLWNECRGRFCQPQRVPPFPSREAVEAVETARQKALEEQAAFQRFWSGWQSELARDASDWLACFAVVAAPAEVVLNSERLLPGEGDYDLVVIEQADRLSDGELLALARRGRRCVLVGLPPWPTDPDPAQSASAFHRAWHRLHPMLKHRDCHWLETDSEIVCQLAALTELDRRRLEAEPLADHPEVELRILPGPTGRPILAEVAFPHASFSIAQSKGFLYRQLGELPLRPESEAWSWSQSDSLVVLELSEDLEDSRSHVDSVRLELEPGIVEVVVRCPVENEPVPAAQWRTQRLEFSRLAGWDVSSVQRWLSERLALVPPGSARGVSPAFLDMRRTNWLARNLRAERPLAEFVHACWAVPSVRVSRAESRHEPPPLRLEAVGGACSPRTSSKTPKGRRASDPPATLPIDLSDPRQRQRLPLELQLKLPMRGQVNPAEAEHIVALLSRQIGQSNGMNCTPASCAVLSWAEPQLLLMEHLWRKSAPADGAHVVFATLSAFRDRQADVVLVSLVASPAVVATPLAEHPADWWTMLGSARREVILVGDPAALARRAEAEATADAFENPLHRLERELCRRLLRELGVPLGKTSGVAVAEDYRP